MSFDFNKEAQILIHENRLDEAVTLLQKHLAETPENWKPLVESGDSIEGFFWNKEEFFSYVEFHRNRLEKSVFWRSPSYSRGHYQLSFIFIEQRKIAQALAEIDKGLLLEPDHPQLLWEKAYILGQLGQFEPALILLRKAFDSRPWNSLKQKVHVLNETGTYLMNLDKLDEAEETIIRAISLQPENPELEEKLRFIKKLQGEKPLPMQLKKLVGVSGKPTKPARLLEEGQKLNDIYEVETFLGEGAFAEVYRVRHPIFGRQALKIFKVSSSIETINESLKEAVLLSKLGHRGIVRVFDAGSYENATERHGYFTMEYIAGGNLFQHWQRYGNKLMPIAETVELVSQIAEALALAHQDNPPIIHRDVKPHNILIGYDALGIRACLSDFGLAKTVDPLQLAASVRGTIIYKAPETFADLGLDSCAGDVWAVGIVLYQLLTNNFPFELNVHEQLDIENFYTPLISPQEFNISVDERLAKITRKCLAIEKEQRYQNAGQLLTDLQKWKHQPEKNDISRVLDDETKQKIKEAFSLAYEEGDITNAGKILMEIITAKPELLERYQPILDTWKSGKIM